MDCFQIVLKNDTITSDSPPPQWWLDQQWAAEDEIAKEATSRRRKERVESLRRFYERELKRPPAERVGL
jgi:hypothetical protein